MSNIFNQFLSGFAGGLFGNQGYLKDYQHAARLYRDNYYGLSPKAGWSYFLEIGLNPKLHDKIVFPAIDESWYKRSRGKLGLLAKTVDLPRFSIATETLNQYNKKTVVQSKITYNPINITFHDDMDNIITDLWKNYYQYYYADSRYTGFNSLSRTGSSIPEAYKNLSEYSNRAYAYGLNNGQTEPFFSYITVFLLNRRRYSAITLINPIITEWAHAQLDQSNGTKLLDSRMTVSYEAVYYDTLNRQVTKSQPGFNEVHYDNTPSPLSTFGNGRRGLGGLLNGASDVLGIFDKEGPLSVGDILNAAIGTKNVIQNARALTRTGVRQELYSITNSVFANAARGQNDLGRQITGVLNTPVNISLAKPVTSANETVAVPTNVGAPIATPVVVATPLPPAETPGVTVGGPIPPPNVVATPLPPATP